MPGARNAPPPARQQPPEPEIDREKTCPLLMRVFPKLNGHHKLDEFSKGDSLPPEVSLLI